MTEIFSDVDRFLMTSSILPLPIHDVEPDGVFRNQSAFTRIYGWLEIP